ncbi:hypothetical protein KCU92_g3458, partial [Aureobasidium melanogenum]
MMPEDLPYHSKKHVKDDAFGPAPFPSQKRVKHNEDQPQGIAKHHAPLADFAETTTRPFSPDGGVAIDEETLVMYHSHIVLSCDDDSSDDSSHYGSHNDHQPRRKSPGAKQVVEPLGLREGPNGSFTLCFALTCIQSPARQLRDQIWFVNAYLPTILRTTICATTRFYALNPRVGMAVEGGKLYLAQTLHHYYHRYIRCSHHGPEDGRPGHHRAARKVHETGKVYRVWFCALQPKGEGHRIDNTDYIELAIAQLDRVLFDRILHEMIRQLRSRNCQPVARHHSPQPDDFDYHALL